MAVDLKVRDLEMIVLLAETLNFHVVADSLGIFAARRDEAPSGR